MPRDYDDEYDDDLDDREERPDPRRRSRGNRDLEPHRSGLILALGIIGLIGCQICAPIAWILGRADLKKMDMGIMDEEGRSNTHVGMILGLVGSIFLILGILLTLLYLVVVFLILGVGIAGAGAGAR